MKPSSTEFKPNPFIKFRDTDAISLICVCFLHSVDVNSMLTCMTMSVMQCHLS